MAVLVEAISVIVRRRAIDRSFEGGWAAFLDIIPNSTGCYDDELCRVGFMAPADVEIFVAELVDRGLTFIEDEQTVDVAVVDQRRGPTVPSPWLRTGFIEIFNPPVAVKACWLEGSTIEGLAVPPDWNFDNSLSSAHMFIPMGTEHERLRFLRKEGNVEVYHDEESGREVYVSHPVARGTSDVSVEIQLRQLCIEVLSLQESITAIAPHGDNDQARHIMREINERILPVAQRIVDGPGKDLAFAHFTLGLITRILRQPEKAEPAFRTANELEPGSLDTLLELVRALGEQGKHAEALPFARECVNVDTTCAAAWANLAMTLIQTGQKQEARSAIDRAVSLDPNDLINQYIRDHFDGYFK